MKNSLLKTLLALCFTMVCLCSAAAKSLKITATITGVKDGTEVALLHGENNNVLASSTFEGNHFKMDVAVADEPNSYVIYFTTEGAIKYAYIFCANEDITVSGDIKDMPNGLTITGSDYNEPLAGINKLAIATLKKKAILQKEMNDIYKAGKWKDSLMEGYRLAFEKADNEQLEEEKKYIGMHLDQLYCVNLLNTYKNYYTDEEVKSMYKKMPAVLKKTKYGKAIKQHYSTAKLKPGDKYYDFKALGRDGNIKFSQLFSDNKYVLLVLGSPGCSSSMASMPMQQDLNATMSDKLTLAMYYDGANEEDFKGFADAKAYPWAFMWNREGSFNTAYIKYRAGATPTFFLFDKNGRLVETWIGYLKGITEDKIQKLLNK